MLRLTGITALLFLLLKGLSAQPSLMSDSEINEKVRLLGYQYHVDTAVLRKYDKIITFDRDVFVGRILNITYTDVRYTCPPDDLIRAVPKSDVSQILYADGRRDVFIALEDKTVHQTDLVDTSKIIVKNQKDWMKVIVTENPADAVSLSEKGSLKAHYEASVGNANNDELLRQANTILKKKAAVMQAHLVLIETKFFKKSYGELPRVEVLARAFGYEN